MKLTAIISKIAAAALVAAAALSFTSCDKTPQVQLPSLKAAFGSDSYTVEPGGTISLAFVVNGHDNVDIDVTATASNPRAAVTVKNPLMYQGEVVFTAPAVSSGEVVVVTLRASDSNGRSVDVTTDVEVSASTELAIGYDIDVRSLAAKPGDSFEIPFTLSGIGAAVLSEPEVSASPSAWTVKCSAIKDGKGTLTLTAPAALTESVTVNFSIKDDYNRVATSNLTIAVVPVTETEGAANSYIVKPGSTIGIKAVEGNSATALTFNNASLLWQDKAGLVKSVSASPSAGVIVVVLNPSVSGNAVVTAKNNDEVVWSWHLWVTDYDPDEDPFSYTAKSGKTYVFMDRNLGAMNNTKYSAGALGLLYQWGRKDPFVGSSDVQSAIPVVKYDIDGNEVPDVAEERPVYNDNTSTNLQLAIQNPNTFYHAPASAYPVVDWLTDKAALQENDFWGGISGYKTKYDPCPEGWMVPPSGELWDFRTEFKKDGGLTTDGKYDPSYPWYIEYDDAYSIGFRYKDKTTGKEYWWPFCGTRHPNKGDLERVNSGAQYCTSTNSGSTVNFVILAWGNPTSVFQLNRTYGSSVRCIREK